TSGKGLTIDLKVSRIGTFALAKVKSYKKYGAPHSAGRRNFMSCFVYLK
ncbi:MAG: hypothetical protein HUJ93_02430, partial [Bacteroidales bacterium]|nr:hypothetical protein [Bacteroidales bacterium]